MPYKPSFFSTIKSITEKASAHISVAAHAVVNKFKKMREETYESITKKTREETSDNTEYDKNKLYDKYEFDRFQEFCIENNTPEASEYLNNLLDRILESKSSSKSNFTLHATYKEIETLQKYIEDGDLKPFATNPNIANKIFQADPKIAELFVQNGLDVSVYLGDYKRNIVTGNVIEGARHDALISLYKISKDVDCEIITPQGKSQNMLFDGFNFAQDIERSTAPVVMGIVSSSREPQDHIIPFLINECDVDATKKYDTTLIQAEPDQASLIDVSAKHSSFATAKSLIRNGAIVSDDLVNQISSQTPEAYLAPNSDCKNSKTLAAVCDYEKSKNFAINNSPKFNQHPSKVPSNKTEIENAIDNCNFHVFENSDDIESLNHDELTSRIVQNKDQDIYKLILSLEVLQGQKVDWGAEQLLQEACSVRNSQENRDVLVQYLMNEAIQQEFNNWVDGEGKNPRDFDTLESAKKIIQNNDLLRHAMRGHNANIVDYLVTSSKIELVDSRLDPIRDVHYNENSGLYAAKDPYPDFLSNSDVDLYDMKNAIIQFAQEHDDHLYKNIELILSADPQYIKDVYNAIHENQETLKQEYKSSNNSMEAMRVAEKQRVKQAVNVVHQGSKGDLIGSTQTNLLLYAEKLQIKIEKQHEILQHNLQDIKQKRHEGADIQTVEQILSDTEKVLLDAHKEFSISVRAIEDRVEEFSKTFPEDNLQFQSMRQQALSSTESMHEKILDKISQQLVDISQHKNTLRQVKSRSQIAEESSVSESISQIAPQIVEENNVSESRSQSMDGANQHDETYPNDLLRLDKKTQCLNELQDSLIELQNHAKSTSLPNSHQITETINQTISGPLTAIQGTLDVYKNIDVESRDRQFYKSHTIESLNHKASAFTDTAKKLVEKLNDANRSGHNLDVVKSIQEEMVNTQANLNQHVTEHVLENLPQNELRTKTKMLNISLSGNISQNANKAAEMIERDSPQLLQDSFIHNANTCHKILTNLAVIDYAIYDERSNALDAEERKLAEEKLNKLLEESIEVNDVESMFDEFNDFIRGNPKINELWEDIATNAKNKEPSADNDITSIDARSSDERKLAIIKQAVILAPKDGKFYTNATTGYKNYTDNPTSENLQKFVRSAKLKDALKDSVNNTIAKLEDCQEQASGRGDAELVEIISNSIEELNTYKNKIHGVTKSGTVKNFADTLHALQNIPIEKAQLLEKCMENPGLLDDVLQITAYEIQHKSENLAKGKLDRLPSNMPWKKERQQTKRQQIAATKAEGRAAAEDSATEYRASAEDSATEYWTAAGDSATEDRASVGDSATEYWTAAEDSAPLPINSLKNAETDQAKETSRNRKHILESIITADSILNLQYQSFQDFVAENDKIFVTEEHKSLDDAFFYLLMDLGNCANILDSRSNTEITNDQTQQIIESNDPEELIRTVRQLESISGDYTKVDNNLVQEIQDLLHVAQEKTQNILQITNNKSTEPHKENDLSEDVTDSGISEDVTDSGISEDAIDSGMSENQYILRQISEAQNIVNSQRQGLQDFVAENGKTFIAEEHESLDKYFSDLLVDLENCANTLDSQSNAEITNDQTQQIVANNDPEELIDILKELESISDDYTKVDNDLVQEIQDLLHVAQEKTQNILQITNNKSTEPHKENDLSEDVIDSGVSEDAIENDSDTPADDYEISPLIDSSENVETDPALDVVPQVQQDRRYIFDRITTSQNIVNSQRQGLQDFFAENDTIFVAEKYESLDKAFSDLLVDLGNCANILDSQSNVEITNDQTQQIINNNDPEELIRTVKRLKSISDDYTKANNDLIQQMEDLLHVAQEKTQDILRITNNKSTEPRKENDLSEDAIDSGVSEDAIDSDFDTPAGDHEISPPIDPLENVETDPALDVAPQVQQDRQYIFDRVTTAENILNLQYQSFQDFVAENDKIFVTEKHESLDDAFFYLLMDLGNCANILDSQSNADITNDQTQQIIANNDPEELIQTVRQLESISGDYTKVDNDLIQQIEGLLLVAQEKTQDILRITNNKSTEPRKENDLSEDEIDSGVSEDAIDSDVSEDKIDGVLSAEEATMFDQIKSVLNENPDVSLPPYELESDTLKEEAMFDEQKNYNIHALQNIAQDMHRTINVELYQNLAEIGNKTNDDIELSDSIDLLHQETGSVLLNLERCQEKITDAIDNEVNVDQEKINDITGDIANLYTAYYITVEKVVDLYRNDGPDELQKENANDLIEKAQKITEIMKKSTLDAAESMTIPNKDISSKTYNPTHEGQLRQDSYNSDLTTDLDDDTLKEDLHTEGAIADEQKNYDIHALQDIVQDIHGVNTKLYQNLAEIGSRIHDDIKLSDSINSLHQAAGFVLSNLEKCQAKITDAIDNEASLNQEKINDITSDIARLYSNHYTAVEKVVDLYRSDDQDKLQQEDAKELIEEAQEITEIREEARLYSDNHVAVENVVDLYRSDDRNELIEGAQEITETMAGFISDAEKIIATPNKDISSKTYNPTHEEQLRQDSYNSDFTADSDDDRSIISDTENDKPAEKENDKPAEERFFDTAGIDMGENPSEFTQRVMTQWDADYAEDSKNNLANEQTSQQHATDNAEADSLNAAEATDATVDEPSPEEKGQKMYEGSIDTQVFYSLVKIAEEMAEEMAEDLNKADSEHSAEEGESSDVEKNSPKETPPAKGR